VTHLSVKAKLSIGLSVILLVAFAAINILNYNVSRTALKQNMVEDVLPRISNDIYREIQRDLITPIQVSSLMANDTFLKDWVIEGERDVSKITKYLWEIKEEYGFFSTFLISDKTRKYYHFKGVHKTISPDDDHDVWYFRFVSSGDDYDLDVDTDEASQGALTIFINHRLEDYHGNLLGVTGVGLKMSEVGRLLHSYQTQYDNKIYLVDKKGLVQVHPEQELILEMNIRNREGLGEVAPRLLRETSSKPEIEEYESPDGGNVIVVSRYIPEFEWFLILEHSEGETMREIRATFFQNIFIGLAVTVLVIVINVLLVNHYQGKLEDQATTDELTGLPNRRLLMTQLKREMANASRAAQPLSLLMIDLDHFKQVNDKCGHDVGDAVLKQTVGFIRQALREGDLAGRLGGEEFAVILPQTGVEAAREVAERLRRIVEQAAMPAGVEECDVTISVGVATNEENNEDLEGLIKRADEAMYEAKSRGRNTVCLAETAEPRASGQRT
jgi:diguanylate cyclase (GGDEF)-like protein